MRPSTRWSYSALVVLPYHLAPAPELSMTRNAMTLEYDTELRIDIALRWLRDMRVRWNWRSSTWRRRYRSMWRRCSISIGKLRLRLQDMCTQQRSCSAAPCMQEPYNARFRTAVSPPGSRAYARRSQSSTNCANGIGEIIALRNLDMFSMFGRKEVRDKIAFNVQSGSCHGFGPQSTEMTDRMIANVR
ncbi:hypothetical protein EXIGLDRAFT_706840 [Exidia glandulosa HHB12029]|uniref:Uncharacterized protein n=1 Tax=Exidia glandulosa HHB12029 TaxID=1314781 RepID=A0A165AZ34_EXIGL|nr:hypothetical protein EXIGLDRAFT_706840 [Exidia glandulosa HHB12029]